MLRIAGQTAGPIGLKFFVDTHGRPGGVMREETPGRHEPPLCRHEPPRFARKIEPPLCRQSLCYADSASAMQ